MRKKNKKNIVAIYTPVLLSVFFLFLVTFSCGITGGVQFQPAIITYPATDVILIEHNTNNTLSSFKGYYIYYKIYKNSEISNATTDKNYLTDSTRITSLSTLTTRNYRPIKLVTVDTSGDVTVEDDRKIQIKPPEANLVNAYRVYIDVSTGTADYPPTRDSSNKAAQEVPDSAFSPDGNKYQILYINDSNRYVVYRDTSTSRGFFNEKSGSTAFDKSHEDMKKMLGSSSFSSGDILKIVFAVIPFGIDFSLLQHSYGRISVSNEINLDYTKTP